MSNRPAPREFDGSLVGDLVGEDCGSTVRHVMPTCGRAHETSVDCWCMPQADDEKGPLLWIHRVFH